MKWVLIIALISCELNSNCQETNDSVYFKRTDSINSKSYYLNKSIHQKRTARVLLIGGTVIGIIGYATFEPFADGADVSGIMIVLGVVADITSIVFFSNASKNKKLAASVSFKNQPLLLNNWQFYTSIKQPSIVLKIRF